VNDKLEALPMVLLKKFVEMKNNLAESRNSAMANNPVNVFCLTKLLTIDMEKIVEAAKLLEINLQEGKLDKSSLSDAVSALSVLQDTYNLKSEDLANGIVSGVKCQTRLDPSELFVLGDEFVKLQNDLRAIEYFKIGYKIAQITEDDENAKMEIAKKLLRALKRSKNLFKAVEFCRTVVKDLEAKQILHGQFVPGSYHAITLRYFQSEVEGLAEKVRQSNGEEKAETLAYVDPETLILAKACRGEIVMNSTQSSLLHCRYASSTPFTKLAAFKIEEMSLDPYLVVFHDVVTDSEIKILEEISEPKFTRSGTVTIDGDVQVRSSRVSEVAWHTDESHKIVETLSRRIEDMTGLTTATAEMLQVQRYEVAGHYGAHYDFATDYETPFQYGTGNRIATVLFYVRHLSPRFVHS
jgi:prolyl 4-hydroxylase